MKIAFIFTAAGLLFSHALAFAEPMSFQQITDNIYAGGKPSLDDLEMLRSLGVKEIINLQGGNLGGNAQFDHIVLKLQPGENPTAIQAEATAAESLGMREISLPLPSYASLWSKTPDNLNKVLDILKSANDKIYVHCEHGIDRTGLVISLFRVQQLHESPEKAKAEWRALQKARPIALMSSVAMVYYFDRITSVPRESQDSPR